MLSGPHQYPEFKQSSPLGGSIFIYVRHAKGEAITLQFGGLINIRSGDRRRVSFSREMFQLFDSDGRNISPRKVAGELKAETQGQAASA